MIDSWSGHFTFGESSATYVGPADQNSPHAHVATQVVLARGGDATVTDVDGASASGAGLLIRPLTAHVLSSPGPLWLIYLEPESALSQALLLRCAPGAIAALASEFVELARHVETPADWVTELTTRLSPAPAKVDARLLAPFRCDAATGQRAQDGGSLPA